MSENGTKFWLEDYKCLFINPTIFPTATMTDGQRLNTMTWLILIITLILFLFGFGNWWLFLILGIILILFLYYSWRQQPVINHYTCNYREHKKIKEKENPLPVIKTKQISYRPRYR